jgi:hypothetical protein
MCVAVRFVEFRAINAGSITLTHDWDFDVDRPSKPWIAVRSPANRITWNI